MEDVRREIDRALESVFPRGGVSLRPSSFYTLRSPQAFPLVNIAQDKDNIYVDALAPGVDPGSLDLSVLNKSLTLSGERKAPDGIGQEQFHRRERTTGKFSRTIELPSEVDASKVNAKYTDGLLSISLAKAETAKPKQIQVSLT
jgi:HSP20 family protein